LKSGKGFRDKILEKLGNTDFDDSKIQSQSEYEEEPSPNHVKKNLLGALDYDDDF